MARVSLEGVTKSYGRGDAAVRDLDLEVRDREFLVLVGPSGCGKTTTLRMIAGLESLSSGRIFIGDKDISRVAPKDRDIAMVFQSYALYPHMTVYKNMAFGLELRYGGSWLTRVWRRLFQPERAKELAVKRRQVPERVRAAAQTLGIEHLLKRKPHQLSGGERQRVALGRSIVREPAAVLFDEPLSNLDARLRTEMRVELKRLHRQLGATMIYVTHDQVEALTLGDRIAVMQQGELLQVGTPMEVYDQPHDTFVAQFLGSPGMNLWPGRLVRQPHGFGFIPAGMPRAGSMADGSHAVTASEPPRGDSVDRRGMIELRREQLTDDLYEAIESKWQVARGGKNETGQASEQSRHERGSSTAATGDPSHGLEVTLGVRPEDVMVEWGDETRQDHGARQEHETRQNEQTRRDWQHTQPGLAPTWDAQVVAVDRLGDSAMLYLAMAESDQEATRTVDIGGEVDSEDGRKIGEARGVAALGMELVARASGRIPNLVGARVRVGLELERIHFFDHKSGINLLKAGR